MIRKASRSEAKAVLYKQHSPVYESVHYKIFEVHEHNRPQADLPQLEESMAKYGWFGNPITTTKISETCFRILQGHHRFMTAKKLGIPVLFMVIDDDQELPSIFELERGGHQTWKMGDYVHAYASSKNADYEALLDFHRETGLSLSVCGMLCLGHSDTNNFTKHASSGNFRITNMDFAMRVANAIGALKNCGIEFCTHRPFILALLACMRIKDFSSDRFVHRVRANPTMMRKSSNREDYIDQIEAVYNFGMRERLAGLKAKVFEDIRSRNAVTQAVEKKAQKQSQSTLFGGSQSELDQGPQTGCATNQ